MERFVGVKMTMSCNPAGIFQLCFIQVLNGNRKRADDVLSFLRWMWGASELGKLGLGEVTSSDSVPVAIRSFAKSDNPYKARTMAGM